MPENQMRLFYTSMAQKQAIAASIAQKRVDLNVTQLCVRAWLYPTASACVSVCVQNGILLLCARLNVIANLLPFQINSKAPPCTYPTLTH